MDAVLERLAALPTVALYLALAATAAVENFFPPFPADTVVAFGSFLAARGSGSMLGAFLATWIGNLTGAMGVYALGRRYGAGWVQRRLGRFGGEAAADRLRRMHARYGLAALFVSRFIPGARALVPPFAGALRMRPLPVGIVIATASGLWYGLVTVLAYRAGADWHALLATLGRASRVVALVAVGAAVLLGGGWLIYRARQQR
ncbi:MAG TPA: VTT domain-containing protein [Gemmatimonadaceae bacterium]